MGQDDPLQAGAAAHKEAGETESQEGKEEMKTEGKLLLPMMYIVTPIAVLTYIEFILPVTGFADWDDAFIMSVYLGAWSMFTCGVAFRVADWWDKRSER